MDVFPSLSNMPAWIACCRCCDKTRYSLETPASQSIKDFKRAKTTQATQIIKFKLLQSQSNLYAINNDNSNNNGR